nr:hypothetical protein [uncultured Methanobacterium sp.]
MAPICSNSNCGNIKRVEGDVCPECGSPAKDMGFKEGTSMIKLKKETMNQIEAESQEITDPKTDDNVDDQVDNEINTAVDEPNPEVINTSKGINSPILKILVFIGVVIVFYILFTSLF